MPDATEPDKKQDGKLVPLEINQAAGTKPVPTDVAKMKLLGNKAKLSQREVDQRAKVREMEDHVEELKEDTELAWLDVENAGNHAVDLLEAGNMIGYAQKHSDQRYLALKAGNLANKRDRAIKALEAYREDIS